MSDPSIPRRRGWPTEHEQAERHEQERSASAPLPPWFAQYAAAGGNRAYDEVRATSEARAGLNPDHRTLQDWAEALFLHPDLTSDIAECHAVYEKGRQENPFDLTPAARLLDQGVQWLQGRYALLWPTAPDMPGGVLHAAIWGAIASGTWGEAIVYLSTLYYEPSTVSVTFFEDARQLCPPWKAGPTVRVQSELQVDLNSGLIVPPHMALVLHIFPPATPKTLRAALERALEKWLVGRLTPIPGKRHEGNKKPIVDHLGLYQLWREHPTGWRERADLWQGRRTITWAAFLTLAHKRGLTGPKTAQSTIRTATIAAIKLVAPGPESVVALSFDRYVASASPPMCRRAPQLIHRSAKYSVTLYSAPVRLVWCV